MQKMLIIRESRKFKELPNNFIHYVYMDIYLTGSCCYNAQSNLQYNNGHFRLGWPAGRNKLLWPAIGLPCSLCLWASTCKSSNSNRIVSLTSVQQNIMFTQKKTNRTKEYAWYSWINMRFISFSSTLFYGIEFICLLIDTSWHVIYLTDVHVFPILYIYILQALTFHFQSYMNKMTLALSVDPSVIPDPHLLSDDLEESLKLIRDAVVKKGLIKDIVWDQEDWYVQRDFLFVKNYNGRLMLSNIYCFLIDFLWYWTEKKN